MSKFKAAAAGFLSSLGPQPNLFMEQAKEIVDRLGPAEKAHVLAQLAVAEEINRLRNAVSRLDTTISMKS